MKSLIFRFGILFFALFLPFVSLASQKPTQVYYYNIEGVDESRRTTTLEAIEHMDEAIKCVEFEPYDGQKVNNNKVLSYFSVGNLGGRVIGLFSSRSHMPIILLANHTSTKKLIDFPEDYFFKIVLHETAHALGMRGSHSGHPFPIDKSGETHFSPGINVKTDKELSETDVKYLNLLLCGE